MTVILVLVQMYPLLFIGTLFIHMVKYEELS